MCDMKGKMFGVLLVLCFQLICSAQGSTVEVDYSFRIQAENGDEFTYQSRLVDNGDQSIFINLASGTSTATEQDYKKGVYLDKASDCLRMTMPIFSKDFYVEERGLSQKFRWELSDDTPKEILGYQCRSARIRFRGRDYVAYYASDLLFDAGPYKFRGLPGLILEIHTVDFRFHYVANAVRIKREKAIIKDPYSRIGLDKFITFSEFKTLFLAKLRDAQRKFQSEEKGDVEYSVNDQSMELAE